MELDDLWKIDELVQTYRTDELSAMIKSMQKAKAAILDLEQK